MRTLNLVTRLGSYIKQNTGECAIALFIVLVSIACRIHGLYLDPAGRSAMADKMACCACGFLAGYRKNSTVVFASLIIYGLVLLGMC